jgi:hypothetical protein
MHPFGDRLGGLHGEPVCVERLGVVAGLLEAVEMTRGLLADGYDLQSDDVDIP